MSPVAIVLLVVVVWVVAIPVTIFALALLKIALEDRRVVRELDRELDGWLTKVTSRSEGRPLA